MRTLPLMLLACRGPIDVEALGLTPKSGADTAQPSEGDGGEEGAADGAADGGADGAAGGGDSGAAEGAEGSPTDSGAADGGGTGDSGASDSGGMDGSSGGAEGGSEGGSGGEEGPTEFISVEAVLPTDGPNSGGLELVLSGAFSEASRLWVDGQEASLLSVSPTELRALLPPAPGVTGPVDLRVTGAEAEDTLEDGFTYWEDATGQASAVLFQTYIEDVSGGWYPGSGWFLAAGLLVEPADGWWTDGTNPGMESCGTGIWPLTAGPDATAMISTGPAGAHSLPWVPEWGVYAVLVEGMAETSVVGQSFDYQAESALWPEISVSSALTMPSRFEITSPRLDGWWEDDLFVEYEHLTWTSSGADYMQIMITEEDTGTTVYCTTTDDGDFLIPSGALDHFDWEGWPLEAVRIRLTVSAVQQQSSVLSFNNGELRAEGLVGYTDTLDVVRSVY